MNLSSGSYDWGRVISEVFDACNDDRRVMDKIKSILPSRDNPHYDKIMNFLKENKKL